MGSGLCITLPKGRHGSLGMALAHTFIEKLWFLSSWAQSVSGNPEGRGVFEVSSSSKV